DGIRDFHVTGVQTCALPICSGFLQIKSLVEGALAINPQQEIHLYWSNRQPGGFYLSQLPLQWAQQFANVHYHPIIEQHSNGWDRSEERRVGTEWRVAS